MLPKALKSCPKLKKSPDLVTLDGMHIGIRLMAVGLYIVHVRVKSDPIVVVFNSSSSNANSIMVNTGLKQRKFKFSCLYLC